MTTDTSNITEKNTSLMDKETLLTLATQMCNIANGLLNFMNNKHTEHINNARKKSSIFFLNNALHRMDSCVVLLKYGSLSLKGKYETPYTDPFSMTILVRSIYESLVLHYYYILLPQEEHVSDVFIGLWKMSGMYNRLKEDMSETIFSTKYQKEKDEYQRLKSMVMSSVLYKNASRETKNLLDLAMKELKILKVQTDIDSYKIKKMTYGMACGEIFKGTFIEKSATIVYKLLSAISHPSYLNYMQIKNYSGTYNKYTETTIEGGIIYLRRLMSDVLKVMPEGNQYIDTLSSNIKSWYNTWDLGLYKNVNV